MNIYRPPPGAVHFRAYKTKGDFYERRDEERTDRRPRK